MSVPDQHPPGLSYVSLVQEIRISLSISEIAAVTGVKERQVQHWAAGSSRLVTRPGTGSSTCITWSGSWSRCTGPKASISGYMPETKSSTGCGPSNCWSPETLSLSYTR